VRSDVLLVFDPRCLPEIFDKLTDHSLYSTNLNSLSGGLNIMLLIYVWQYTLTSKLIAILKRRFKNTGNFPIVERKTNNQISVKSVVVSLFL